MVKHRHRQWQSQFTAHAASIRSIPVTQTLALQSTVTRTTRTANMIRNSGLNLNLNLNVIINLKD